MTADPGETARRALAHAERGWPVFPCLPGEKVPATRHGFRDATTDPEQIRRWWERQPAANLAIATGAPGPDVLDVDQRGPAGSGFAAYRRLRRAGLLVGAGAVVATPGGGLHAYFAGSGQRSGSLPRHHLDFKAAGGYVLAPPSQVGGRPYRLIARHADHPVALDWQAVTSVLEPRRRRAARPGSAPNADPGRLAAWVEQLSEGNRNSGLFWATCRAIEADHDADLGAIAAAAAVTGLNDREIERTIASARRATQPFPVTQPEREAAR